MSAVQGSPLAVVPASSLPTIIAADKDDILGKLAKKVAAHHSDISTLKGRAEIRSLAAEIASAKMDLIRLGKKLTEGWRESTKKVNAECNLIEAKMDALKETVRAPLTEYENIEKQRVASHEAALAAIAEPPEYGHTETSGALAARLAYLKDYPPRNWQEFTHRAEAAIAAEITRTEGLLAAAEKREAVATELERLRAAEAARRAEEEARLLKEHEAQIAAEAAARAKREAEEKAAREAAAAAKREQDAKEALAQAEKEKADAIEAAKRAAEDAAKKAARAAEEAKARALREKEEAIEAERRRAAAAAAAEKAETERRAANKAHRGKINTAAMEALVAAGLDDKSARAAIIAIARGSVPHVAITY